jgi:diguanylate cyclase (GGDEF)-like protein
LNRLVDERTADLQRANEQLTLTNETLVRIVVDLEMAQTEISRNNDELERLASRDPLTGCLNRRAFFVEFEKVFAESRDRGSELCCLMVDIDYFKRVNDQFGHAVGDQAIQAVATCLSAGLRLTDMIARYGGEEFCLVFPGTTLQEASSLAERVRARVEVEAAKRVRTVPCLTITVSVGIASTVLGAQTTLELVDQADKALYAAKEGGRNCVMALDRMNDGASKAEQVEPHVKRITPRLPTPSAA